MTADKPSDLVPKLRFPEFRDDPTWSAPQLADLYGFKRTNTLSRDKLNYQTGTIRNIHYGDIHTKFQPLFRVGNEHVPYINTDASANGFDDDAFCEEGDIVLADASEDLDDVGKAIEVVSLDGGRVVAGTHTILATRRGSVPIIGFGGQLFQSAIVRAGIKKEAQGSKVFGISANRISAVPVPVPPTEAEQQKIADCLGTLDNLIAAEGRKLNALRQHKQGLMQQLFPLPGETMPRLRFPEFRDAEEWNEFPLGEIVDIASGQVDPTRPPYCDLPHIGGENIESHTGNLQGVKTARQLRLISGKYPFDENDVLYSKIRPVLNKVGVPDFRGICSADIYPIRPSTRELLREYLIYLLRSDTFLQYATKHSARSKIPKINRETLLAYMALIPLLSEQRRIAACFSSFDEMLATQSRKVESLKAHKQGLLQQLFPSPEGA